MPILDLNGSKPLEGYKSRRAKRTLGDPGTVPAGMLGGSSSMSGFAAAKVNRLTMDFLAGQRSADQDLFGDNVKLRGRARKLALDNPLVKNFLFKVPQNIIGAHGIGMVPKITNEYGKETAATKLANERIAKEWHRFAHSRRCSADGKLNLVTMAQQAVTNVAREGEHLTKFVFGRQFNDYGIAFQSLDNDQLDDTMMVPDAGNGNQIRMGVEVDQYGRPEAYHLFNAHPFDTFGATRERKRIPAEFIVHPARWERPGQTRGYTWLAASMLQLNQFDRYEEAVIVASRASAAKFGVIQQTVTDDFTEEDELEEDGEGAGQQGIDFSTGEFPVMGPGQTLNYIDPRFPTTTHKEFTQTVLRIICSGLLMQYPVLANDLEGVNFSSIRAGMVDERDMWRILQRWFIESWYMPLYQGWLKFALLTRLSDITLTQDQMEQVEWMPRGFDWVDPQKDADSIILQLGEGLSTLERECAARGLDWRKVLDQRAIEAAYAKEKGVVLGVDLTGDQAGKGVAAGDESAAATVAGAADSKDKPAAKGKKSRGFTPTEEMYLRRVVESMAVRMAEEAQGESL